MPASWAYILLCADGSFYTGCTTFLEQRYGQHQAGIFDGYTSKRRPVVMVWSQEVQSIDQAIFLERQIKGWSRAKKEALIRGEFDLLPLLSRSAYRRSGR